MTTRTMAFSRSSVLAVVKSTLFKELLESMFNVTYEAFLDDLARKTAIEIIKLEKQGK